MDKRNGRALCAGIMLGISLVFSTLHAQEPEHRGASAVEFQWDAKIPMRDGVRLSAQVYTPKQQAAPAPCIFVLTPYTAQGAHERGIYFASQGLPFVTVDSRGRGSSEGEFKPFIQEASDGHDIVEWLARQPYCNGKVAMWGGSYVGYDQWATVKEFPEHLATIVPVASVYPGVDFPMRNGISYDYVMRWLTYVSGKASQQAIFNDRKFWSAIERERFEGGIPFNRLDSMLGNPSDTFQEWVAHPHLDAYWDRYVPSAEQYAKLDLPILTITGSHDSDQPGALTYYRTHMRHGTPDATARHYLVIGPWDHAGTRTPKPEFGGVKFGPASLVDLPKLHLQWYRWTMAGGPRPDFLQKRVAYYVMGDGAEHWRYADILERITAEQRAYFLDSTGAGATDVLTSGSLSALGPGKGGPDRYVYDPRDLSSAARELRLESQEYESPGYRDQRDAHVERGRQLVYHTAPFEDDTEISGFFKLSAWIGIDQPDTDFSVEVYVIGEDGQSRFLSDDRMRARYREGLREQKLIDTSEPLRYDFDKFTFTSYLAKRGSRLRLVIRPINSPSAQKNFNSGKPVSEETLQDARPVTVTLHHDPRRPSALHVPIGQPRSGAEPAAPPSAFLGR